MKPSLGRLVTSWGRFAGFIIFPSFCEVCHSFLEMPGEKIVCRSCLAGVRASSSPHCLCCGRFFEGAGESHFCRNCLEKIPPFSKHRSCAPYRGIIKDMILLFKYRGFEVLGEYLADFILQSRGDEEDLWQDVDVIIPVPLHRKRQKKRGFNQAQVLAKRLGRLKQLRVMEKRLIRVKNVPPQTVLQAAERAGNVRGAFRVRKGEDLQGKIILLVDDVYTTGSTLLVCSRVLKDGGVKEVRAVTVAQA